MNNKYKLLVAIMLSLLTLPFISIIFSPNDLQAWSANWGSSTGGGFGGGVSYSRNINEA